MRQFPVRLLTGTFFRIGNTTFGGGDPTIAALQRELVVNRGAITPEEFGVLYAISRLTPGTNMLAFCAGAGWLLRGWVGALIAVTAVTLPSAIIAVLLLYAFESLMRNPIAAAGISAMIAAAVGLMFAASYLLVRPHLKGYKLMRTGVLAAGAFLLVWKQVLSPVQVLALGAAVGFFWPEPSES